MQKRLIPAGTDNSRLHESTIGHWIWLNSLRMQAELASLYDAVVATRGCQ